MQSQAADSLNPPAVSATFANGVVDSLPIVIGYVPVAFAFGLSAVKLGFSPLESIFFSCIIYAGASQFVITALLSAGMSLWVSALTVMAMDVRHLLYGPALRHRIVSRMSPGKTAMWAFGLTDEVFAAATARLMRNNRSWSENWMLGIALGALFGNGPLEQFPVIEASLAFMLPALFLSFLLAAFRRPQSLTIAAALAGALLGVVLFSIPVAILAGIGAGCIAALFQPAPAEAPHEH